LAGFQNSGTHFSITLEPGFPYIGMSKTKLPFEVIYLNTRQTTGLKVKLSLCLTKHHVMETYWMSGDIAPHILNLGTWWSKWSDSRYCRFNSWERTVVSSAQDDRWTPELIWTRWWG